MKLKIIINEMDKERGWKVFQLLDPVGIIQDPAPGAEIVENELKGLLLRTVSQTKSDNVFIICQIHFFREKRQNVPLEDTLIDVPGELLYLGFLCRWVLAAGTTFL